MKIPHGALSGPWLQVGPIGNAFFPLDPTTAQIDLDDIVPALAKTCRFGGHCREFYSVAQHSVLVSRLVPPGMARIALLHDAAEAYTGDICQPFKEAVRFREESLSGEGGWSSIVKSIEKVVAAALDIPWPLPREVKHADLQALATEQRDLMPTAQIKWGKLPEPWSAKIIPLDWRDAERLWWERWLQITGVGRLA